jgi:plastocyanin domain-containing protein
MRLGRIILIIIVLLVVGAGFLIKGNVAGNVILENDVQHVVISMKNWVYSPMIIEVEAGNPVSITLDNSVRGCFRDLVIPELNIRKNFRTSKDTLIVNFEPGEYTYACSMFMGQGKIIAK